jgi:hypothetical protein
MSNKLISIIDFKFEFQKAGKIKLRFFFKSILKKKLQKKRIKGKLSIQKRKNFELKKKENS